MTTVALDHLRPHRPLILPPISHITNILHHTTQNNLRFCFTIHIKNRMLQTTHQPLSATLSHHFFDRYTYMPFEKYGLEMNDYEWYTHTSRIKAIYRKQKQFIQTMEARQVGQTTFLEILQHKPASDTQVAMGLTPAQMAPTVYYVTPKTAPPPVTTQTTTVQSQTIHNQQTTQQLPSAVTTEQHTLVKQVNVDNLVRKITKTLEEQQRQERLKKGW